MTVYAGAKTMLRVKMEKKEGDVHPIILANFQPLFYEKRETAI